MSVCGRCVLYWNDTCEGDRRGSEICQDRLFNYIDKLESGLNHYTNGQKPDKCVVKDDLKLGAVTCKAGASFYKCPNCGQLVLYGNNHCPECGQKLDWSKVSTL